MTEVEFHVGTADRIGYACRLLRKARRAGSTVAVAGDVSLLGALDQLLWTFEATEFLPHLRLGAGATPSAMHQRTPVWLVDDAADASHLQVLVHLGHDQPARGFESYPRLIEVVSGDADQRLAARGLWRHYAARGYRLTHREVSA